MKRWIRWAARLYPAAWRERYGDEFAALLEDAEPRWRDGFDVVKGAIGMHLAAWSYGKTAAGLGLAGAVLAAAFALWGPGKYVSNAVVRIPDGTPANTSLLVGHALSRASLNGIIRKEDLYKSERRHRPLEDIIESMKHDIRIQTIEADGQAVTIRVDFAHPDPLAAQRVNRDLISTLMADEGRKRGAQVIDPASLPERPERRNLARAILGGLVVGMIAGGLWVTIRRRPARWTLRVAAAGIAGMLLGGAVSFAVADRFVSSAAVLISKGAQAALPALLSEESLAGIVRNCDLYPGRHDAIERIRRDMRVTRVTGTPAFDIYRIAFTHGDRYKAQKAVREIMQETAMEAARARNGGRPLEGASDNQAFLAWRALPTGTVEMIDAASFPEAPVAPNRPVIAGLGLLCGLLAGAIPPSFRRARIGN